MILHCKLSDELRVRKGAAVKPRVLFAEFFGTALLVFFGAGAATLSFGFHITGTSRSAGVVATALVFGLVVLVLVYALGPISGCHINPAITMGFLVARKITVIDAVSFWIAQVIGAIAGAAILFGIFSSSPIYRIGIQGLGADGYGKNSMILANAAGAFGIEIVLTFTFVFVILAVTRRASNATVAGLVIGLCLTLVHIVGIPVDGTSVNPARSIGPALFVGGAALSQLWVFIFAPLIGGALSAIVFQLLYPKGEEEEGPAPAAEERAR
jgi:aquaporin Z